MNQVIWEPYRDHRTHRPFEQLALYSGYFRFCSTVVPYFGHRCLRQFGLIQNIPRSYPRLTVSADDMWRGVMEQVRVRISRFRPVQFVGQVTDDYYLWYYGISHVTITPPGSAGQHVHDGPSVASSPHRRRRQHVHDGPSVAGPSDTAPTIFTPQRMDQIALGIRDAMDLINRDSEAYNILSDVYALARGREPRRRQH